MKKNKAILHKEVAQNYPIDDLNYNAEEDVFEQYVHEGDVDDNKNASIKKGKQQNIFVAPFVFTQEPLDIPGGELDDQQEDIGAEDEENNYYSIGLDNHNELYENEE
jgi:hypothetical protein